MSSVSQIHYLTFDSKTYTQEVKDVVTNILQSKFEFTLDNDKIIIFSDDSVFLLHVLFGTCCVIPLRINNENNISNYIEFVMEYIISTINSLKYEKNIINSIDFKCFFYTSRPLMFPNGHKYNFFRELNSNSLISKFNTSIGLNKFEYQFNFNDLNEYKINLPIFGGFNNTPQQPSSIFGNNTPQQPSTIFGNNTPQQPSTIFGGFNNNTQPSTTFGGFNNNTPSTTFGNNTQQASANKQKTTTFGGFSNNTKK